MFDVFITTNGPGEIITWVTPVVKRLKEVRKDARISVFLLPCRFAAGADHLVAEQIPEVDYVFSATDFYRRLINMPFIPSRKGVILFLGGDLGKTLLLKLRYVYKAVAYTEGDQSFRWFYDKFFLRDRDGDLMFSHFDFHEDDHQLIQTLSRRENIVFFPGSRPAQFKHLFPLFQETARLLPGHLQPVFNISPFIPSEMINEYKIEGYSPLCIQHKHIEVMKTAKLAVSIPGTNNVQLAFLNVPTLIVFPFNFPEVVNFTGLFGMIMNLPFLRSIGKKWALKLLNRRVRYTSLVNSKAQEMIFPELRGELNPQQIKQKIEALLADEEELKKMTQNLKKLEKTSSILEQITSTLFSYV